MTNIIILLGAPGSGKGTQAKELSRSLNIAHISTGDLLRNEIDSGSDLGKKISDIISKGHLIDDVTMTNLLSKEIKNEYANGGFILDGYPRNIAQAKILSDIFDKEDIKKFLVVKIDISEEIIIKRIIGRFSCANCGHIYNKYFNPPKVAGVCDECGSTKFSYRKDDNETIIKERLKVYNKEIPEVLDYYKDCLVKVNGEQDSKKLLAEILANLNK